MSDSAPARVLLADDHRLVADALARLLAEEFDVVGVVEDGLALMAAARETRPDVIIADISMPHLSGIDVLAALRREKIDIPVVMLTMHREVAYARRALREGARGYVLKHSASGELVAAVRAVLEGRTYLTPAITEDVLRDMGADSRPGGSTVELTPRQREVLQLLAEGLSAKEIGEALDLSSRTVESHKYQMMERLGINTSAELLLFAIKQGIVDV